jgi:hypothetical protein
MKFPSKIGISFPRGLRVDLNIIKKIAQGPLTLPSPARGEVKHIEN